MPHCSSMFDMMGPPRRQPHMPSLTTPRLNVFEIFLPIPAHCDEHQLYSPQMQLQTATYSASNAETISPASTKWQACLHALSYEYLQQLVEEGAQHLKLRNNIQLVCREKLQSQRHAGYTSPHHLERASLTADVPADRLLMHPALACALPPLFLFWLPLVRPQTVSPLHPMADSCLYSVSKELEHTKPPPCKVHMIDYAEKSVYRCRTARIALTSAHTYLQIMIPCFICFHWFWKASSLACLASSKICARGLIGSDPSVLPPYSFCSS